MSREGMVLVRKMTAAGHEQGYWERPEAVRAEVGAGKYASGAKAAEKRGANRVVLDKFFGGTRGWSGSSSSPESMKMRGAAAALVAFRTGQSVEAVVAREQVSAKAAAAQDIGSRTRVFDKHLSEGSQSEAHIDTLEAMSAVSQSMYEEETVTLYRGIGRAQLERIRETGYVDTGSLVSFSESKDAAAKFAKGGFVLRLQVPRGAIVASHRAFKSDHAKVGENTQGFLKHEEEVVVLSSGRLKVNV